MEEATRQTEGQRPGSRRHAWVAPGVFFVLFGSYIGFCIDPKVIYHAFGVFMSFPAYRTGWAFLEQHLDQPGGPVEVLSALLSQCYYDSWIATAMITSLAWLIWAGTRSLIGLAGERRAGFLAYVPVVLLLALVNRYESPLTTGLVLLSAVWFAVGYEKVVAPGRAARVALYLAMCALLYLWAGGASLLFALLVAVHEGLIRRGPVLGWLVLLLGLAVPAVLGTYVFDLPLRDASMRLLPSISGAWSAEETITLSLFVFIPLVVIGVGFWNGFRRGRASPRGAGPGAGSRLGRAFWPAARTVGPILVAVLAIHLSTDATRQASRRVVYYSCLEMWPQLLQMARRLPAHVCNDPAVNFGIGRALYHTGRLGDDLFSYPQRPDGLFLYGITSPAGLRIGRLNDFVLELGYVNGAERLAFESLENLGDCPSTLEHLALVNLVKGQTETARVFLHAQSKDLVTGAKARGVLGRLDADPGLEGEEQVRRLRSVMFVDDFCAGPEESAEPLLLKLLGRNPSNRMAFEYLMAFYLVTNQADKVAENIGRLDDLGYREIPVHYQEAMLLHAMRGGKAPSVGARMDPAVRLRFEEYMGIWNRTRSDRVEARRRLAPAFGRSYFFYSSFGESGVWK